MGKEPITLVTAPEWDSDTTELAASYCRKEIEDAPTVRPHVGALKGLAMEDSPAKRGPASKIRSLVQDRMPGESMSRSLNTGANLNTLRQIQSPLRSVAAGVRCWASFCDLVGCAYFRPLPHYVLHRIPLFNPGRTVDIYLSHLGMACQLLNIPPTWYTEAV